MNSSKFKKALVVMLVVVIITAVALVIYLNMPEPEHVHNFKTIAGYEATCTEPGLKTYEECTECGYSTFTSDCVIAAKGHVCDEPEEVVTKKATCTTNGTYEVIKVCDVCKEEYSRVEKVLVSPGHDYITVEAKAATCLPGHYEYEYCLVCGDVSGYVEIPPAYDHISSIYPIVYWPSVVNPTCTTDGSYKMAVCCTNDNCDYLFGELSGPYTTEALGHRLATAPSKGPTCTSGGHSSYEYCVRCSYVGEYDTVPALGHDMVEVAEKPATCTANGHSAYLDCSRCSHVEGYKTLYAFGHTEGEIKVENLVEPTCAEWGSYDRVIRCVTCNEILYTEHWNVEPVVHNELATIEAKAPTCTEYGWSEYIGCAKCGYAEDFENYKIPETGHTYVYHEGKAPECFANGYHPYETCSVCDYTSYEEIPAIGNHTFGADGYCQNPVCTAYISINLAYADNGNGTWTVTGIGSCTDTAIVIPEEYMGAPVVAISSRAFENESEITSIYIPDSVKVIESYAFFRCKNLDTVVIGSGVEVIGKFAFSNCRKLSKVTIGSGLTTVGDDAFNECPISEVAYLGTTVQWNNISFGGRNEAITSANRKYI